MAPFASVAVAGPDQNTRTGQTSILVNDYPTGPMNAVRTLVSYDTDAYASIITPPLVSYSATSQTVCPGAKLFSYSVQSGPPSTAAYTGFLPSSSPTPSSNWPIWTGSTSLAQYPSSPFLYLSTLAIPSFNVPKDGSCLQGDVSGLVSGACILRAINDGPPGTMPEFTQSDNDCLHDDAYDRYDSTELVGDAAGNIYAAFHNPVTQQIDFYWANTPFAAFVRQPGPFPGLTITEAPRMVTSSTGGVHLIAGGIDSATGRSEIYWAMFNQGFWTGAAPASFGTYLGNGATIPEGNGYKVPLHAQYDVVDIPTGGAHIVYTSADGFATPGIDDPSGYTTIISVLCALPGQRGGCDESTAHLVVVPRGTYLFNPAAAGAVVQQAGGGSQAAMKVTWLQLSNWDPNSPGASWVDVYSGDYDDTNHFSRVRKEAGYDGTSTYPQGPIEPCPTEPNAASPSIGFWDAYNEHLGIYQDSATSNPTFVRAFPDTSYGACAQRTAYWSSPSLTSATNVLWP